MKITAVNSDEFRDQFRLVLQQSEFTSIRGVVYFWKSERPIPRVIGESNILYIGQTSRTLCERHGDKRDFEIEVAYFNRFYSHVIKKYGPLSMDFKAVGSPKRAEWEELKNYYETHLEYPPLNRAVPSEPALPSE